MRIFLDQHLQFFILIVAYGVFLRQKGTSSKEVLLEGVVEKSLVLSHGLCT